MLLLLCSVICFIFIGLSPIYAGNGNEETQNLVNKLKSNFNRFTPPKDLLNNSVQIFVELFKIMDVEEKQGLITLKIMLIVTYASKSAAWDPDEYGGIEVLTIPEHIFWTPPISKPNDVNYKNFSEFYKQH